MTFTEKMKEKARSMGKSIVLPESTEPRMLKAARIVADEKIAETVYLVGDPDVLAKAAGDSGIGLDGFTIVDPTQSQRIDAYAGGILRITEAQGSSS